MSKDALKHFGQGFRAILPLWLGMAPFAVVYATMARSAGLDLFETQVMSLIVFAGGAQFSAAGLFAAGATGLEILFTTLLLNLRHLLYGLSLGQVVPIHPRRAPLAAFFLTDEAYGVTVARGRSSFAFLLGAELSVYVVWNACTLVGALAGQVFPDPQRLGVDFVFPLAFLALLIPLLHTRVDLLVAVISGLVALVANRFWPGGLAVLISAIAGSLLGAWLAGQRRVAREIKVAGEEQRR